MCEDHPDLWAFQSQAKPSKNSRGDKGGIAHLLHDYTLYYCELLTHKLGGILVSPNKLALVNKSIHILPLIDQYTDRNELAALCEILGPSGIAFLDAQLLNSAVFLAQGMKDHICNNQDMFERLRNAWEEETRAPDIKRLKCMFVNHSPQNNSLVLCV